MLPEVPNNLNEDSTTPKENEFTLLYFKRIVVRGKGEDYINRIKALHPRPVLDDLAFKRTDGRILTFTERLYEEYPWIAGCVVKRCIFCFWCILTKNKGDLWSMEGVTNIGGLHKSIKDHMKSKTHSLSIIQYKTLYKETILNLLNKELKNHQIKTSQAQRNNVKYATHIFSALLFLSKQGLALRGDDETKDSFNKGNLKELLLYDSRKVPILKDYNIEERWLLTSATTQNEMIEIIGNNLKDKIKREISLASFVSVIADEATDYSKNGQLIIIFRYKFNGLLKERFICVKNISTDKSAISLAKMLEESLKEYNIGRKLIGQCYDGAPVMSGKYNGVQKLISDKYKNAVFIHCFAHQLNLIVNKIIRENPLCSEIMDMGNSVCKYFGHSSIRSEVLKKFVSKKIPDFCQTRWVYNGRIIEFMAKYNSELVLVFADFKDNKNCNTAEIILTKLKDPSFEKKILFFKCIFNLIDISYNLLQKKNFNVLKCNYEIEDTINKLNTLKATNNILSSEEESKIFSISVLMFFSFFRVFGSFC